jgi:hypothetical protein
MNYRTKANSGEVLEAGAAAKIRRHGDDYTQMRARAVTVRRRRSENVAAHMFMASI